MEFEVGDQVKWENGGRMWEGIVVGPSWLGPNVYSVMITNDDFERLTTVHVTRLSKKQRSLNNVIGNKAKNQALRNVLESKGLQSEPLTGPANRIRNFLGTKLPKGAESGSGAMNAIRWKQSPRNPRRSGRARKTRKQRGGDQLDNEIGSQLLALNIDPFTLHYFLRVKENGFGVPIIRGGAPLPIAWRLINQDARLVSGPITFYLDEDRLKATDGITVRHLYGAS